MPAHSIFDIPHIKDGITRFLSISDLAHCVLASKEWSSLFMPVLWRTINFNGSIINTKKRLPVLECHPEFIQSLIDFDNKLLSRIDLSYQFPNLRSLDYSSTQFHSMKDCRVSDFLAASPRLEFIGLQLCISKRVDLERLINLLSSHNSLRRASFGLRCAWDPALLPQLLQVCGRFDSLKLHLEEVRGSEKAAKKELRACDEIDAALENMQPMQVRDLSIRLTMLKRRPNMLSSLLKKCTLLERLELIELRDIERLQQVLAVFQNTDFHHLKHLNLSDGTFQHGKADIAMDLIRALGTRSRDYDGGSTDCGRGLESFETYSPFAFGRKCARALVEYHSKTLVALDQSRQQSRDLQLFLDIVCSLPKLRSLRVGIWLGFGLGYFGRCISSEDSTLQSPWLCTGLATLDLDLGFPPGAQREDSSAWDDSQLDRRLVYLFEQIGRLINLREMSLKFGINLLELRRGYLSRLSGLKQLRGLDIRGSSCFHLGEMEAVWVDENWSRLVHLLLPSQILSDVNIPIENGLEDFKATMQARRPWIWIE
ncbi:hypothetical protein BGZ80_010175 [Entomortierella chlamydospora]|uniref:F-box domain-containing protein n=1 Tax=Entomortierella chlamydospora TaxID=101097 RepID=A0A9P6T070_9FUNG|nr:hypothetical protein BGZ79_009127 [Entomortierella chlamydospora]KAG0014880.1 hypothetical protein BGZ80_010175 [Entomortierella chlamydospora]